MPRNGIRAHAVEEARSKGMCTQCFIKKAAEHRFQCQRCIDTNKRKNLRRRTMGTKPKGMSVKDFREQENERRQAKRKKNADDARERYHRQKAEQGIKTVMRKPMSEEHKLKIRAGVARAKARREAFGGKDTLVEPRKYKKRVPIASLQMAGMVNDLERFIGNLGMMSATDYLEAREELIMSIIKRGGKLNGNS